MFSDISGIELLRIISKLLGLTLIGRGKLAALVLLIRAAFNSKLEDPGRHTLWGLFFAGLVLGGLLLCVHVTGWPFWSFDGRLATVFHPTFPEHKLAKGCQAIASERALLFLCPRSWNCSSAPGASCVSARPQLQMMARRRAARPTPPIPPCKANPSPQADACLRPPCARYLENLA